MPRDRARRLARVERRALLLAERRKRRREAKARRKQRALQGEEPLQRPRTLESTRVYRPELDWEQEPPFGEEAIRAVLRGERRPRVLLTTSVQPTGRQIYDLIGDLLFLFPGSVYRERDQRTLEELCKAGIDQGFTDLWVIVQGKGLSLRYLQHVHLPDGPVYLYRLSSVVCSESIPHRGTPTPLPVEVVTCNFQTNLGRHIERSLSALFPHEGTPQSRQVVLVRNQRDYIFLRFYRYIFEASRDPEAAERVRVRTQELGPRFTLKLLSVRYPIDRSRVAFSWRRSRVVNTGKRVFAL